MSENTEETGPVLALAVTQQGSTFAERAKAQAKQVEAEADEVEDKSVAAKRTTRKTTAKKG